MSFQARLVLGDNSYNILDADFEVSQQMGRHNLPNRNPDIGLIHLVIESSNASELFEWAMSSSVTKNGSIVFYRRDSISPLKTLEFERAFCVGYKERFNAEGDMPMKNYLTLSPYSITMQGVNRVQDWAGFESSSSGGSETETTTSPQNSDSHDNEESSSSGSSNNSNNSSESSSSSQNTQNSPQNNSNSQNNTSNQTAEREEDIPSFRP